MLIEPILQQLHQLRLPGMAAALEQLAMSPQHRELGFEERLSLMIQHEITTRDSRRLAQRLRWAKLPQIASLEDLDTRTARGIDPKLIAALTSLNWITSLYYAPTPPLSYFSLDRIDLTLLIYLSPRQFSLVAALRLKHGSDRGGFGFLSHREVERSPRNI